MPLFWKKHTEPEPLAQVPETNETPAQPAAEPQPVIDQGREIARRAVKANVLPAEELVRLQEQHRLHLLRLESVQRQIDEVGESIRLHNEYVNLKAHHDEVSQTLFEQNKQVSSLRTDEQRLMRFEQCEAALPLYLRLLTDEELQRKAREQTTGQKERLRQLKGEADRAAERLEAAYNAYNEATAQMTAREDALATGHRTDGLCEAMEDEAKSLEQLAAALGEERKRYIAFRDELSQQLDDVRAAMAEDKSRLAPLDASRASMEHMDGILVHLDHMASLQDKRDSLKQEIDRALSQQRELNFRLTDMFRREQDLESQLTSLHGEVAMHREVNHGVDGQSLQLSVMTLRARKQDLTVAAEKWRQICDVYQLVDQKRTLVRSLQQTMETEAADISRMELDVSSLDSEAAQRRYDYTLSKGQNVIKLRADLREGVACTVCGAKTHPFHSDTLLEQNKLIGEWKSEADRLGMELKNAREQLLTMQLTHATHRGILTTQLEELERVTSHLNILITQWSQCEQLDLSLRGCQPSTMADSRTQTIRGLIETCVRDEGAATERLKTYNYHQQAINRAHVSIDAIENERTELHTGLSETNTGCQVLANLIDRMQEQARAMESEYQAIYKMLDAMIDVADWHAKWRQSHDNFRTALRQSASEWQRLSGRVGEHLSSEKKLRDDIALCNDVVADLDSVISRLTARRQALSEHERAARNLYNRLFGEQTAQQVYKDTKDNTERQRARLDDAVKETLEIGMAYAKLQGVDDKSSDNDAQLTELVSQARRDLDDWMYNFRIAGNPPCRMDELHELFGSDTDWQQLRTTIREARQNYSLTQIHEGEIRGKLLTLEQGGGNNVPTTQRESLLKQRRELMLSVARIEQRIEAHEQAIKQLEVMEY